MPRPSRFSIRLLMIVVALIALDFALIRFLVENGLGRIYPTSLATLPMINLLLINAPKVRAGRPGSPFWIHFEACGGVLVLIVGFWGVVTPRWIIWPLMWLVPLIQPLGEAAQAAIAIGALVTFYTCGMILAAMLVARFAAPSRPATVDLWEAGR